jgi:hypothetical protein
MGIGDILKIYQNTKEFQMTTTAIQSLEVEIDYTWLEDEIEIDCLEDEIECLEIEIEEEIDYTWLDD